jgi:NitT/TauT family transport system ATP-binding protein
LITHDISEAISVADKIFVLSRRPASVVATHTLNFPESEPLKRRENKEFSHWFEILWKELNA